MTPESLDDWDREQVYNGLDVTITADILDTIKAQLDDTTSTTYAFSRALQGPVLDMRIRGCLIDQARKLEVIDELYQQMEVYESYLDRIVYEGIGLPVFNFRSNKDLRELFYVALGLPTIRRGGSVTCDRGAREKLAIYPTATVLVTLINALAELGDKISVLRTDIDPDGRIRTSYNIAGTSTGRFSSSLSEFGTGGNLQNVEASLRSIFIADPGYKFAKFDAKSGESFIVGAIEWNLFRDARFLDACQSGDVHTSVARGCWPNLPWTGDRGSDKEIAEGKFYRHLSYRDACKRIGHGSNYLGGAPQISAETRVPINIVTDFQTLYFETYPAHRLWHKSVEDALKSTASLTTLTGRKRHFWRRRHDPKTLKEAVAYDPQGSLADIVNQGMLQTWQTHPYPYLMFQDHDATTWMYKEADEHWVVPLIAESLSVSLDLADGRVLTIPYDCEVGWNKGKYDAEKNPDGLRGYTGSDDRRRSPKVNILDRIIRRGDGKPRSAPDIPAVGSDLDNICGAGAESVAADVFSTLSEFIHADSGPSRLGEDEDAACSEALGDDAD